MNKFLPILDEPWVNIKSYCQNIKNYLTFYNDGALRLSSGTLIKFDKSDVREWNEFLRLYRTESVFKDYNSDSFDYIVDLTTKAEEHVCTCGVWVTYGKDIDISFHIKDYCNLVSKKGN